MSEKQGWIKLYRKLLHDPIFTSDKGLKIWIWCLLRANHKNTEIFLGRQRIILKQGQFVFGRYTASEELKISPSTTWFWIKKLKNDDYIDIKPTNKFSIVTIKKWKEYQTLLTTNEKQVNTDNNDNNVNNIDEAALQEINYMKKQLLNIGVRPKLVNEMNKQKEFWRAKKNIIRKCLINKEIEDKAAYIAKIYYFWKENEAK
ncbi:MAG: hypothetical protein ABIG88_01320 [Patescibacteria group bacterium]|nr:hypothetical protein [Patescibacteria group bacterium]